MAEEGRPEVHGAEAQLARSQVTVSLSGDGFVPPLVEAPATEGAGRLARYVEEVVT